MIVLLNRASNNQPVSLTKQIADSGEGQVWETNQSGYLAKIYHDPTPARIEKLKVMLANPPADPMLKYNHVSIAWVSDLLKDSSGKYLGFLMPAIRDSKQLSSVYNPKRRKRVAPGFNWYYLHVTALNTAWIIQEIHAKVYVLGDIKLENILVNDRAMVAVIDTDSFQVQDSQSNKVYRCTVGSEGFTPPELLGKDFDTTNQTEIHDRFRLGVLIHYLLFGYHPFSGQWTGVGESPEQIELIRQGYWYAAYNSPIRESRTTISLDVVHPELKKLFLQCFNEGHTQPHLRPSAQDWHKALENAVNELDFCSKFDSHHYSKQYGKCYWCERAVNLGFDIFPGVAGTAKILNKTTNNRLSTISAKKSVGKVVLKNANVNKLFGSSNPNKTTVQSFKIYFSKIQKSKKHCKIIAGFLIVIIVYSVATLIGKGKGKIDNNPINISERNDFKSRINSSEKKYKSKSPVTESLTPTIATFNDVPRDHWAYPFIESLIEKELIVGISEREFQPDSPITRAQLSEEVKAAFKQEQSRDLIDFGDISQESKTAQKIDQAVRTGFLKGYPGQVFRPDQKVPRLQVLVALVSGLGLTTNKDPATILSSYQDADQIPGWAKEKIAVAIDSGLIVNRPSFGSQQLYPNEFATRAEVVAMIYQGLVKAGRIEPISSPYIVPSP